MEGKKTSRISVERGEQDADDIVLAFTRSRGRSGVEVDLHDPFAEAPGGVA